VAFHPISSVARDEDGRNGTHPLRPRAHTLTTHYLLSVIPSFSPQRARLPVSQATLAGKEDAPVFVADTCPPRSSLPSS